ncbi:MAG: hypothetical protein HQL73_04305 [Magnetococcales bacterium]|nr:hypothetical protein [Magnetococcales bacterium]
MNSDSKKGRVGAEKTKKDQDLKWATPAQDPSAENADSQARMTRLMDQCAQLKGEITSLETQLLAMRSHSEAILQQAKSQSQYADSLARLADANWR